MGRGAPTTAVLIFAVLGLAAACGRAATPTPTVEGPRTITIWDTYYVRFQADGVWYHAVPVDAERFLGAFRGGRSIEGPTYLRREGQPLWECHPAGYQIPAGATVMMSSSRAPVTLETMDAACR